MDEAKMDATTTASKIPPPLNINDATDEAELLNQKAARIVKYDLELHEAVMRNDTECVREALAKPVDVNSRNNYGRAPLHWAASKGNAEVIKMLLEKNCDFEAKDVNGMRPLHMAARYGNREAVEMLINAGADTSAVCKKQYSLLMFAARGCNVRVIEYLSETRDEDNLNVNATDCNGSTALHHSVLPNKRNVITALTRIPQLQLEAIDKDGQTPLHQACSEGYLESVDTLIKLGASLKAQDNRGGTPLHVATTSRQTEIAQLLLEAGADTEIVDEMGYTPLHLAASQGCMGILKSIIQHNGSLNKQCKNGNTPLHLAILNNQEEIVETLIYKDVDLNCLNNKMQSPIHVAAETGNTEICRLLLTLGANIEQKELSGKTPLYIAARGSFTTIVDMIIKTARLDYPLPEHLTSSKVTTTTRRKNNEPCMSEKIESVMKTIAKKQLAADDWKKLAAHWKFTAEQIQAIEHQCIVIGAASCLKRTIKRAIVGETSYKEHGYRMLMIWAAGLEADVNLPQQLHDALVAIDRRNVAESVRRQLEDEKKTKDDKRCCPQCSIT